MASKIGVDLYTGSTYTWLNTVCGHQVVAKLFFQSPGGKNFLVGKKSVIFFVDSNTATSQLQCVDYKSCNCCGGHLTGI